MGKLRSPKICAALVIIAFAATLIANWGMGSALRKAAKNDGHCKVEDDLKNPGLRLEMAGDVDKALAVLGDGGDTAKVTCIRHAVAKQIDADYLFIPAYSLLTLALFLFVRSLWGAPKWSWVLLAAGLSLAAIIVYGDVRENLQIEQIIKLAERMPETKELIRDRLLYLQHFTFIKMSALALSAVLLSVFWRSRSARCWACVPRFLGLCAAALFVIAMALSLRGDPVCPEPWRIAFYGMVGFFFFWLTGLIHAVAVVVDPNAPSNEGSGS